MNAVAKSPRVGVLASTLSQVEALAQAVRSHGYVLLSSELIKDIRQGWQPVEADVWLADLSDHDEEILDVLLDSGVPVLLGIERAPQPPSAAFNLWQRRVYTKLRGMVGEPSLDAGLEALESAPDLTLSGHLPLPFECHTKKTAGGVNVCVLAASLGGPAAVKEFLDELPAGLPLAFILAQHIDGRMLDILPRVLGRHNQLAIRIARQGDVPKIGEVLIAPVVHEIDFDQEGAVIETGHPWDGPYAPSIDQVLANVSRHFGAQAMAVIFSGMGSDGSISGPQMAKAGGRIFAQNSESCACSSQPDSMRGAGCVAANGTPKELALLVVDYMKLLCHAEGPVH